MKQILYLLVFTLFGISFLYANEVEDWFGSVSPTEQSTNKKENASSNNKTKKDSAVKESDADEQFTFDSPATQSNNKNKKTSPKNKVKKTQAEELSDSKPQKSAKSSVQSIGNKQVAESIIYVPLKNMEINSAIAYQQLIKIREANPTSIEPDYTIALLFVFTKKDFQNATKHFVKCKAIRPENTNTLINLGTVYLLNEKYVEAFACYKKAYRLGAKSTVMSHNLKKFLDCIQNKTIKLPETLKKSFAELGQDVFKETPPPQSIKSGGWFFEPCSEGYSQEIYKRNWFQLPGKGTFYEFPMCIACKGTGMVKCPNRACFAGKVGAMVSQTHTMPTTGEVVTMQTRQKAECDVCDGTGHVECSLCKGTGFEKTIKKQPEKLRRR